MVVASLTLFRCEKIVAAEVPLIDLSRKRTQLSELLVKACEEFGFFKVVGHGIPNDIIERMESEGHAFFGRPLLEKHRAGPPNPLGYGCKNIGFNGDTGEVEYLLLHTNPFSLAQRSKAICNDPIKFCCVVNDYIEAVKGLACELLEQITEGLRIQDKRVFSRLLKDNNNDSVLRLNYYPSRNIEFSKDKDAMNQCRVGFGEHSDPQILTILQSNDVKGLQISLQEGIWVPVPPDPNAFFVNVGDILQALTNGRFLSARHRAMANNSIKSRMSMVYFGAPPLNTRISPLPELITPQNPCLYRPFTWIEYKKMMYTLRLGDNRLKLFEKEQ